MSQNSSQQQQTPGRRQTGQLQQPSASQLPDPRDLYPQQMQNIPGAGQPQGVSNAETPQRAYGPGQLQQQQRPANIGLVQPVGNNMGSPIASVTSTAGPKTLLASAHRAVEGSDERRQAQPGTTLVPNFRSISPSIFNIDLNQTGEHRGVGMAPGLSSSSPLNATVGQAFASYQQQQLQQQQQNQHIYVSIQPKRTDGNGQGGTGPSSNNLGPSDPSGKLGQNSNMRIKRVGPINKGDKIKFGVIVSRDSKRKNLNSSIENLERQELFETPKMMHQKTRVAIGKHSDAIYREVVKFPTYTTTKTLPTVLINQHTNIIKQFKKNFTRETDAYSKHLLNSSMTKTAGMLNQTTTGGYFTDSETLKSKAKVLRERTEQRTAVKMSKKSWFSEDGHMMSIRDVIEEHAKSVAALNKTFKPNIHLEIDERRRRRNIELEEKGRQIAEKLNLSVQSCCTRVSRMYKSLTDEQPLRQHNKPLTHLMRPSDKALIEKKLRLEDDRRKAEAEHRIQMKRKTMAFSMHALTREFKGGLSSTSRGQSRRVDLKEQRKYIETFRRRKLSSGANDGWDRKRKEIEDSIDNGMTYSHLSRKYPMKREWAKYLVLLRKKEKDRRKKERKIVEIREDLYEKGIVDEKIIAKELDMFEYMEFKKKRDRSKARMGTKAETKYYRPVDTERTLKIDKISLELSEDYDDGPGGFKLEDFAGIETMFSKQSLEQRKQRITRARERIRAKVQKKMEEAEKIKEDEIKEQVLRQLAEQKSSKLIIRSSQQSLSGSGEDKTVTSDQPRGSIMDQVSRQQAAQHAMQYAGEGETGLDPSQKIKASTQSSKRYQQHQQQYLSSPMLLKPGGKIKVGKKHLRPPKIPKASTGQSNISSKIDEIHPTIIEDSQHQESSALSQEHDRPAQEEIEVFSKNTTSGPIRVEIASISGHRAGSGVGAKTAGQQAPPPQNMETMKTQSQQRDYSLEDGGIFEKKTANANTSIEEAKIGESLTQRSYELLAQGAQSASDLHEKLEAQSQQDFKQKFIEAHESVRQTGETLVQAGIDKEEDVSNEGTDALIDDDGQVYMAEDDPKREQQLDTEIQQPSDNIREIYGHQQQQSLPRIRPSTTENVRRTIMQNRRRQLMSGQQQQQIGGLRTSAPNADNTRFGRYSAAQNQKSAGVMTTVYQQQQNRQMMNQDSSDPNHFKGHQTQLAATTSSGFHTENVPRGSDESQMQKGVVTLASMQQHSPAKNMQQFFDKGQQLQLLQQRSATKTQSGATLTQTADETTHGTVSAKIAIWKQLMKFKEEEGLSGHERLPRAQILRIRSKVRRERLRLKRRAKKLERKMTSMGLVDSSNQLVNSMTLKSSNLNIHQLSPIRTSSEENMHRTQTMIGLRQNNSAMVEVQDFTQNQRQLMLDNSRNATGYQSNEVINHAAQRFKIQQLNLTQGISDTNFMTQPQQPTTYFTGEQRPTIEEMTSSSNIQNTTQMLSSNIITPLHAQESSQQQPSQEPQAPMQGEFALGFHQVATVNRGISALSMTESERAINKKNFLEYNRTCVRQNSFKKRFSSHLGRVRQLRSRINRRQESIYQQNLTENITKSHLQVNAKNNLGLKMPVRRNYPISIQRLKESAKMQMLGNYSTAKMCTSQMYPAFQKQLDDRRSMKVFRRNSLGVDSEIENEFTRNQAWNETLNCPYFGLISLRRTQERPINSLSKEENILRPFTTGNQRDRMHIRKVKSAIKHRNDLREMDSKIYNLIDLCHQSTKIEWKSIYKENEEFRDAQKKKISDKEKQEVSLDDLLELAKI